MKIIEVKNLKKVYHGSQGQVALREASFSIEQGEFVALMGPSGSGKTTLLSIIGGLNSPTQGEVVIDEIDIYQLGLEKLADFRREYLGFVFQEFQLIPYLTAAENVMLPLTVTDYHARVHWKMATEVLDKVGLQGKYNRLPHQLSNGEQERVAIARAIVNKPPIILADEPTGSLDTHTGDEIINLFKQLNEEERLTIFMVTHNPDNASAATRTLLIRDGRLSS